MISRRANLSFSSFELRRAQVGIGSYSTFRGLTVTSILLYMLVWNVDLSRLGLGAAEAASRWVAVLLVLFLAGVDFVYGHSVKAYLLAFGLVLLLVPSVVFSREMSYSAAEFCRLLSLIAIFCLTQSAELNDDLPIIVGGLSWAILVGSLLWIGVIGEPPDESVSDRIRYTGLTTHPNNFGFIANIGLAYIAALMLRFGTIGIVGWSWRALAIFFGVVSVFLSGSRTSLIEIGMIALMLLVVWTVGGRIPLSGGWRQVYRMVCFLSVMAALVTPMALIIDGVDPTVFEDQSIYDESNAARMIIWLHALEGFEIAPLTGLGLGANIEETFNPLLKVFTNAPYAHNAWLNILHVAGIPGAAWLVIVIWRCSKYIMCSIGPNDHLESAQAVFFFVSVVSLVLISAVAEGGLQNNYGLNAFFAVSLGPLAAMGGRRATA
jgi:hypothetical protein